jgi:sulfatase modifying factor 1
MNMDNRWAYTLRRAVTAAVMVAAVAVIVGLTRSDPAAQDLGEAVPSETHSGWIGGDKAKSGMLWVQEGKFRFGSDDQYSEEGPVQEVRVDGFWIDRTEVTNAQFQRFVSQTGYVTEAERGYRTDSLQPLQRGSVVFFNPVTSAGSMTDWWQFVEGADWRHPEGPGSSIKGREEHSVALVQRAQCRRSGPIRSDRLRDADGIRASGIDHAVEDGDADGSLGLLAR